MLMQLLVEKLKTGETNLDNSREEFLEAKREFDGFNTSILSPEAVKFEGTLPNGDSVALSYGFGDRGYNWLEHSGEFYDFSFKIPGLTRRSVSKLMS